MITVKTIQYIAVGLLLVLFLECMFTMGGVMNIESYDIIGWIVQLTIVVATVTTAIRLAHKDM
jgi:hypothetical protein